MAEMWAGGLHTNIAVKITTFILIYHWPIVRQHKIILVLQFHISIIKLHNLTKLYWIFIYVSVYIDVLHIHIMY